MIIYSRSCSWILVFASELFLDYCYTVLIITVLVFTKTKPGSDVVINYKFHPRCHWVSATQLLKT